MLRARTLRGLKSEKWINEVPYNRRVPSPTPG